MEDFHHTYSETIHSEIFRPWSKASQTPTSCSQKLTAGRWDKQSCWAPHGSLEEGREALWHSAGRLILSTAFKTKRRFSEKSVKTLFLKAWCYVWHIKSVSFHNKTAPQWFLCSRPSLTTSSPSETDGCSSILFPCSCLPWLLSITSPQGPPLERTVQTTFSFFD